MYSVVNANPAYVLLAALDLLSGCEIRNSSSTFVSYPLLSVQPLLSVHPTLSVQPQLDLKLVPRLHFANVGSDKLGYSGGQKQSEQSNFLFSCPVCTAVQAVKLALWVGLLKYSFSESQSAGFKL